jgi:hypothetical protein
VMHHADIKSAHSAHKSRIAIGRGQKSALHVGRGARQLPSSGLDARESDLLNLLGSAK